MTKTSHPRSHARYAARSSLAALLFAAGCGAPAPTTDDIRRAYAQHLESDPVHEVGLKAKEPPAVIPNQDPECSSDGSGHFDCRIKVIYETEAARRSEEQVIHIRRADGEWVIDSPD